MFAIGTSRIAIVRAVAMYRRMCLVCIFGLAGCAGWSAGPDSPFSDLTTTLNNFEAIYSAQELQNCLLQPLSTEPGSPHQICRDRISQALMAAIDVRYAIFERGLLDTQRYTGLTATIIQLGLTAGASVASGGTTQALAAAATAVGGVNEAVSREVLMNRTATALMSSMQARRNEISLRVRTGLGRTAASYPLGVALADLFAYYRAGTLAGGTTALGEAAGTQAMIARQMVDSSLNITPAIRIVPQASPGVAPAQGTVVNPAIPPLPPGRRPGVGFSRTATSTRLAACVLNTDRPLPARQEAMRAIRRALVLQPDGAPWVRNEASFIRNREAGAEEMRVALLADADVARNCPEP